jgi:mono/diheme cytochrome c family protein
MDTRSYSKTAVLMFALASSLFAQTAGHQATKVTAVAGESWLSHLHRTFDETSMGKTGRLGPAELEPQEQGSAWLTPVSSRPAGQTITLHGVDVYRMNCRGCHGETGLGVPPEINSVINPVRAGSTALVMERMKKSGMSMAYAEANKLAQQAQDAVLERLHKGGQDMPPFSHLSDLEIRSLLAYLRLLADVPGAQREQLAVRETPVRMGEHIVKSTCHICHSASGPNPDPQQLADGAIPPLSTLTSRVNQAQFVRKVTRGAPIMMGTPPLACRGRMPVFYYLSEEEAADVYMYLSEYPPYPWATLDPALATSQSTPGPSESDPPQRVVNVSFAAGSEPAKSAPASDSADMQFVTLLVVAGVLVSLLLAGGIGFTIRECVRLSAEAKNPALADGVTRVGAANNSGNGQVNDRIVA